MAIKRLKSGYQIDYRDSSGRRHRKSFRTLKQAQKALRDTQTAIDRGEYVSPHVVPTLREIAAEWIREKRRGHRPSSVAFWETHLDRHLLPTLGDLRLDRIDRAAVKGLRDARQESGLSAATVNKILTTLSAIFRFAVDEQRATRNPVDGVPRARDPQELDGGAHKRKAGEAVGDDEVLNPAEIGRLLEESEPGYFQTLFMAIALTGIRHDEALALRWGDVDLDAGKVEIQRSLSWARMKGESVRPRFFPPKTAAGRRTLRLPAQLLRALRVWKLQCPPGKLGLVFPKLDGTPMHRGDVLRKGLQPALERAGLRRVDVHSLRHSFATALIADGAPVTEVQHLLGHSSPTVTLEVYSHWFKRSESDSVERLAERIVGA